MSSISGFKLHLTQHSQRWEQPANLVGASGMMLDPFIDIDPLAILKPLRDLVGSSASATSDSSFRRSSSSWSIKFNLHDRPDAIQGAEKPELDGPLLDSECLGDLGRAQMLKMTHHQDFAVAG